MEDLNIGIGFVPLDDDDTIAVYHDDMGKDIAYTSNDIMVKNGDILLAGGYDNIIQTAVVNMRIVHGELIHQPNRGNMIYHRRLKLVEDGLRQIEYDCKNAILYDKRVKDATVVATKAPHMGLCDVNFVLTLQNGDIVDGATAILL